MTQVQALPPKVRLFQIGPQKTGTTALQAAAHANRAQLLANGVYYPGTAVNHRIEVAALVGKAIGWRTTADGAPAAPPPRRHWDALVAEMNAHPDHRVWFGHEYAAGARTPIVQQVAKTFGADLHVLISLRSLASLLPSVWQETNKAAGNRGTFDRWLGHVFDPGSHLHKVVQTRHDQGALVRRWANVVGPDRVTVVVLDPFDHGMLYHAVEDLLELPRGLLMSAPKPAHAANRSLAVPEIELFRQFNKCFRAERTTWQQYDLLAVHGAIARVLGYRTPHSSEAALTMPDWAADLADQQSARNAAEVAASGVRIIGNVNHLALPARRRTRAAEDHRKVTHVPIDLAAEAMIGLAAAALGRGPGFEPLDSGNSQGTNLLSHFTAAELAAELYRRGKRRARHQISSLRLGWS